MDSTEARLERLENAHQSLRDDFLELREQHEEMMHSVDFLLGRAQVISDWVRDAVDAQNRLKKDVAGVQQMRLLEESPEQVDDAIAKAIANIQEVHANHDDALHGMNTRMDELDDAVLALQNGKE